MEDNFFTADERERLIPLTAQLLRQLDGALQPGDFSRVKNLISRGVIEGKCHVSVSIR